MLCSLDVMPHTCHTTTHKKHVGVIGVTSQFSLDMLPLGTESASMQHLAKSTSQTSYWTSKVMIYRDINSDISFESININLRSVIVKQITIDLWRSAFLGTVIFLSLATCKKGNSNKLTRHRDLHIWHHLRVENYGLWRHESTWHYYSSSSFPGSVCRFAPRFSNATCLRKGSPDMLYVDQQSVWFSASSWITLCNVGFQIDMRFGQTSWK